MDASGHMAAAAKAVAATETAADVDALLAVAPAGAVGAEIPDSILHIGVERKAGDAVVLRAGLAERKGSSGLLRAGQPAVKTRPRYESYRTAYTRTRARVPAVYSYAIFYPIFDLRAKLFYL